MIKVERVSNKGTEENKDMLWVYEYDSAQKHTVNNRFCISYRRVCDAGEMVSFYNKDNVLEKIYMIHVKKTGNYYYTGNTDKAIKAYVDLLDGTSLSFYK